MPHFPSLILNKCDYPYQILSHLNRTNGYAVAVQKSLKRFYGVIGKTGLIVGL